MKRKNYLLFAYSLKWTHKKQISLTCSRNSGLSNYKFRIKKIFVKNLNSNGGSSCNHRLTALSDFIIFIVVFIPLMHIITLEADAHNSQWVVSPARRTTESVERMEKLGKAFTRSTFHFPQRQSALFRTYSPAW